MEKIHTNDFLKMYFNDVITPYEKYGSRFIPESIEFLDDHHT
jgi:hypothetical protein